jgi:meiotically up-regulated gene 157 (Mug157) protein
MFRPSDDACIYPLFIPANLFAVQALSNLTELAYKVAQDERLAKACDDLRREVQSALTQYGTVQHQTLGTIWAYEVDGYGNTLMMDDAGVPSLLSLPYLGCCPSNDTLYQRTRHFVLSTDNPYFISGRAAKGVGSPHIGISNIWPMGIIVQAMTSEDDQEIVQCLRWLRDTTAGTGFIHESFNKDDASHFTRQWFAWANTLFGELILMLMERKPSLLQIAL